MQNIEYFQTFIVHMLTIYLGEKKIGQVSHEDLGKHLNVLLNY